MIAFLVSYGFKKIHANTEEYSSIVNSILDPIPLDPKIKNIAKMIANLTLKVTVMKYESIAKTVSMGV